MRVKSVILVLACLFAVVAVFAQATKVFTTAELAKYTGKNGTRAYIAVEGKVYDVSEIFKNGAHYGVVAGKEYTNDVFTQHSSSRLQKAKQVGVMQGGVPAKTTVGPGC